MKPPNIHAFSAPAKGETWRPLRTSRFRLSFIYAPPRTPGPLVVFLILLSLPGLRAQNIELVTVSSKKVDRISRLPGELLPFERVAIYSRVTGFVEKVEVDVGSKVRKGQLLLALSAPEMAAQLAEAEAKAQTIEAQRAEAQARLVAVESTLERLRTASATPGAVAGNELFLAQKSADAARALIAALESSSRAARASAAALRDFQNYLQVTAPFDGVITRRGVHPGALVGPGSGSAAAPLLELEQSHILRLVVAVPESAVPGIRSGTAVPFKVSAYPGRAFSGRVARVSHSLDPKSRTMPVEMDVDNSGALLAPGMYAEVQWMVGGTGPALLVPATSIVTTTERTFVIRVREGRAEWVNVSRGLAAGDLVEVFGPLQAGESIVRRGSDEIREGTPLK